MRRRANRVGQHEERLPEWLSRDPIGEAGGINLYGYVENNPINAIDPLGLDVVVIVGGPTDESYLGHAAIAVSGRGVYSFGTTHPDGTSLADFLNEQSSKRTNVLYRIPTSPEEDQRIIDGFNRVRDAGYSILKNSTCATAASQGLADLGISNNTTPSPKMLNDWFQLGLSTRSGINGFIVPRGATQVQANWLSEFQR